jgi:hypothetical protein
MERKASDADIPEASTFQIEEIILGLGNGIFIIKRLN